MWTTLTIPTPYMVLVLSSNDYLTFHVTYYLPKDHALQNQKGEKLCDQHGKGTHVVMQSHLDASAL